MKTSTKKLVNESEQNIVNGSEQNIAIKKRIRIQTLVIDKSSRTTLDNASAIKLALPG